MSHSQNIKSKKPVVSLLLYTCAFCGQKAVAIVHVKHTLIHSVLMSKTLSHKFFSDWKGQIFVVRLILENDLMSLSSQNIQ